MRNQEFNMMVKELKESKTLKVKDLEQCTTNQLIKIEDIMLDMQLNKNLEKVLDIVTDMVMNATAKVSNKKIATEKVEQVVQDEQVIKKTSKKTQKTAPNKAVKSAEDVPVGINFETLKLGDTITIYSNSIIDTVTTIVFKINTMVVAVDLEDEVSYEFKKEFIEEGGYKFKGKNYFIRLGK